MTVEIGPVNKTNVQRLRELNLQLFPVRYNLAFYKEVVSCSEGYAQLGRTLLNDAKSKFLMCTSACVGGYAVGAICCRREPVAEGPEGLERTYIMTLGVLESYRRSGIGRA